MNELLFDIIPRQALEWAVSLVRAPSPPEKSLLGEPVAYLLYCSQAAIPFREEELADLLEQSRFYNQTHGITGLLCYAQERFVQVLEGAANEVAQLFARIEQDPRHHQVHLLCFGTNLTRQFTDWRMAFTKYDSDFYWLISYLETHRHRLLLPQVPVADPALLPLLHTFSSTCRDVLPHPDRRPLPF